MSKRSQSFVVFGKKIKVFYKNGKLNDEDSLAGFFDPVNWVIYIDARQSKLDQTKTLIHELVHCVFHRNGYHQTNIDLNLEEMLCENIAEMLLSNFNLTQKSLKP
jgi:Zn-dependent peptidase ImmA (M78 family)